MHRRRSQLKKPTNDNSNNSNNKTNPNERLLRLSRRRAQKTVLYVVLAGVGSVIVCHNLAGTSVFSVVSTRFYFLMSTRPLHSLAFHSRSTIQSRLFLPFTCFIIHFSSRFRVFFVHSSFFFKFLLNNVLNVMFKCR